MKQLDFNGEEIELPADNPTEYLITERLKENVRAAARGDYDWVRPDYPAERFRLVPIDNPSET